MRSNSGNTYLHTQLYNIKCINVLIKCDYVTNNLDKSLTKMDWSWLPSDKIHVVFDVRSAETTTNVKSFDHGPLTLGDFKKAIKNRIETSNYVYYLIKFINSDGRYGIHIFLIIFFITFYLNSDLYVKELAEWNLPMKTMKY